MKRQKYIFLSFVFLAMMAVLVACGGKATPSSPSASSSNGDTATPTQTFNTPTITPTSVSGNIITFAGNGTVGYSGDGGPATLAEMKTVYDVAFDSLGNVYISDLYHNVIRKVGLGGIITTFAGNGTSDYSGDGGPATSASLHGPVGLVFDSSDNLFFADSANNCIRKVNTSGIITTIAGILSEAHSGDGGAATSAELASPGLLTFDSSGNLFFTENKGYVRKISTDGIISTVAGIGTSGYSGDGGAATAAEFDGPSGIAVDSTNNIYICDTHNNRVRKISAGGIITTIVGNGTAGHLGDGSAAISAELKSPFGIFSDSLGNMYISDGDRIRKVDSSGNINTIAGTGTCGSLGDGGLASLAELCDLRGLKMDFSGNIYIADYGNNKVRKILK